MAKIVFSPAMIDSFKACPKSYGQVFLGACNELVEPSLLSKRFLLAALSEVHRGRIITPAQAQKFIGQYWPSDKLKSNDAVKAFLFVYKALNQYLRNIYQPESSRQVGVAVKVQARIPHENVYLSDTLDLVFWNESEKILEFVDFHINPLKPFNTEWPASAILVKQFLAQRLHTRWPFAKLRLTFCQLAPDGVKTQSLDLADEVLYKIHWPELVKTVQAMKEPPASFVCRKTTCSRCGFLARCATTEPPTLAATA
jgi:hypothetical protein